MAYMTNRPHFSDTDEGRYVRSQLLAMVADEAFMTESTYSANAMLHPDKVITFVDKHMEYLRLHPAVDLHHYLSNLRLMSRLK